MNTLKDTAKLREGLDWYQHSADVFAPLLHLLAGSGARLPQSAPRRRFHGCYRAAGAKRKQANIDCERVRVGIHNFRSSHQLTHAQKIDTPTLHIRHVELQETVAQTGEQRPLPAQRELHVEHGRRVRRQVLLLHRPQRAPQHHLSAAFSIHTPRPNNHTYTHTTSRVPPGWPRRLWRRREWGRVQWGGRIRGCG